MIRKLAAVLLVALVIAPAGAFASTAARTTHANTSRQCLAVRTKIGVLPFARVFASFGSCVSTIGQLTTAGNAAASCRAERTDAGFPAMHAGKTFTRFYGVGRSSADAFAVCVALTLEGAAAVAQPRPVPVPAPAPVSPAVAPVTSGCGPIPAGTKPQPLFARCAVADAN